MEKTGVQSKDYLRLAVWDQQSPSSPRKAVERASETIGALLYRRLCLHGEDSSSFPATMGSLDRRGDKGGRGVDLDDGSCWQTCQSKSTTSTVDELLVELIDELCS